MSKRNRPTKAQLQRFKETTRPYDLKASFEEILKKVGLSEMIDLHPSDPKVLEAWEDADLDVCKPQGIELDGHRYEVYHTVQAEDASTGHGVWVAPSKFYVQVTVQIYATRDTPPDADVVTLYEGPSEQAAFLKVVECVFAERYERLSEARLEEEQRLDDLHSDAFR